MINLPGRTSFRVLQPNDFDLSEHQPIRRLAVTKKLMPTIIRLAELMAVADPAKQYKLPIGSQEELEMKILAFRDLVGGQHFPLFGHSEDEDNELIEEEMNQWQEGWISQTYHPLLDRVPVRPMGFADHDVDPSDYGDLVALLYWLSTVNSDPAPSPYLGWESRAQKEFKPAAVATILGGMDLKPPLTYLSGLIKTVTKQTDTFFLDACPLCGNFSGPEFSWTTENFIWFRDDWQRAKPIYEGNERLIGWANQNPERLVKISEILKEAQKIHLFYKDDQPAWC